MTILIILQPIKERSQERKAEARECKIRETGGLDALYPSHFYSTSSQVSKVS